MKKRNVAAPSATPDEETDGRRRRGNSSRARIVDAMLQLVRDGNLAPGAARVAEIADVSLRTVFRHFDEMEILYKEIAESIRKQVHPALFQPYRSDTWRERLFEMTDRRIDVYEAILPFKLSGDLRRYQSEYLGNDYRQHLKLERMSMETVLPRHLADDHALLHALLAATGFQGWRILRKDQGLDKSEARSAMLRTVEALLASANGAAAQPAPRKAKGETR